MDRVKAVAILAVLALAAIAIASPIAVQSLSRQADQQSIDIDDEMLAKLEKATWMPDPVEIRSEHAKILKAKEDVDHERLVLAASINITSSSIENAVRAHITTVSVGKKLGLHILITAKSGNESKIYRIVASNTSYSFSEDGSTLRLVGNISRSNAPGFDVGKQIVIEIKIGFTSITSGGAYVKGNVKSLVLHDSICLYCVHR